MTGKTPSAQYWAERFVRVWNEQHKREKDFARLIYQAIDRQIRTIRKEIAAYYAEYGENNVIEYRKLLQALPEHDREMLIKRLQDFAEHYPEHAHLLDVRKSIYKLDRLEGLELSARLELAKYGGMFEQELGAHLEELARLHTLDAVETLGLGTAFHSLDVQAIRAILTKPWSPAGNYSSAVWGNTQRLGQVLATTIADGFARGDSYAKMAQILERKFAPQFKNSAKRIIRTEGTYIANETQRQTFQGLGYSHYVYCAILDNRTSAICNILNGSRFRFVDAAPGVNFPPMHPNCRSGFLVDTKSKIDKPRAGDSQTPGEDATVDKTARNSTVKNYRAGWPVWKLTDAAKELGADMAKAYKHDRKVYIPTKEAGVYIVDDPDGGYFRVYRLSGKDTYNKARNVLNYYTHDGWVRDLIEKRKATDPEFAKRYDTDRAFKKQVKNDYKQVSHFNRQRNWRGV